MEMTQKLFPDEALLPSRITFGKEAYLQLPKILFSYGVRSMIVFSGSFKRSGRLDKLKKEFILEDTYYFEVPSHEPTIGDLRALLQAVRNERVDVICGIGGGSVIDLAKAAAGLYFCEEDPGIYHSGKPFEKCSIPFVAIPTTAGTGAEATPNAVLTNERNLVKKSIRHPSFTADMVILDPSLLSSCPIKTAAFSAMDALTQAIESFFSKNATHFSLMVARQALELFKVSINLFYKELKKIHTDPSEINLKNFYSHAEKMLLGSFYAGTALCHSRLGVIHGLAHPLGAVYKIPHGQICGLLLPASLELNQSLAEKPYNQLARILKYDPLDFAQELLHGWNIENPFQSKNFPQKGSEPYDKIISETLKSGSTKANPFEVTEDQISMMLQKLYS